MMRRFVVNVLLLVCIAYVGSVYIAPLVMCWREGGVWKNVARTCSMGTFVIPGSELVDTRVREAVQRVGAHIDPMSLNELIIRIPNGEDATATLTRTEDALARLMASFPQQGTDIEGYAEAHAAVSVADAESGLVLIPFFVNYGGTGSFAYVGLFGPSADGNSQTLDHLDSLLIGDRIMVDEVMFERSGETLKAVALYTDRAPTAAMAEVPSVPKKVVIPISNNSFGEATIYDRTIEYRAVYKDVLKIEAPVPASYVQTPVRVRGMARGVWFSEASFPITVTDAKGTVLGTGVAQAVGDWMTEDYVPFTAIVAFTNSGSARSGMVILKKDNPSGMPEYDDSYTLPVTF